MGSSPQEAALSYEKFGSIAKMIFIYAVLFGFAVAGAGCLSKRLTPTHIVLEKSTLFSDKGAVETFDHEWNLDERSGIAARKILEAQGRIRDADFDIPVVVREESGPMDTVLVEAVNPDGLKSVKFWVGKSSVLSPETNTYAFQVFHTSKTESKSNFTFVFNGYNQTAIGDYTIGGFSDAIAAISEGKFSEEEAGRYLFEGQAIGEVALVGVTKNHLVFQLLGSPDHFYEFAIRRNPAFESRHANIEQFYEDMIRGGYGSVEECPIGSLPLRISGRETFRTGGGLVRVIPIVESVRLTP